MAPSTISSRKTGFKLKNLPEDAYKGQQQKLKQNLIRNAKLKKNYAKVLKQENYGAQNDAHKVQGVTEDDKNEVNIGMKSAVMEDNNEVDMEDSTSTSRSLTTTTGPSQTVQADRTIGLSYRQRMRARKGDISAVKATAIRQMRKQDGETQAATKKAIEAKRQKRTEVQRREVSRTKNGQPLMKDRMKNILDKLQSATQ